jgi:sugar diacid utilization regulator
MSPLGRGLRARLDQLGNRVTAVDRARIEAAIAERVPRPTVASTSARLARSMQEYGWKWMTERQRAVLQDEAERWQNSEGDLAVRIRGAASGVTNSSG